MGAILYENILRDATVVTDESSGSAVASALNGRSSDSATFLTGAVRNLTFNYGSAKKINALGIGRNNLSTMGATVTVRGSSDNVSYTTLFSVTPTTDRVILELESDYTYQYYNIQISGQTGTAYFTDVALGERLELERDQKGGFISPLFADSDEITSNVTLGQNIVGLTVKPKLKKVRLQLPYYTASSFYSDWAAFVAVLKAYPVYLKWDSAGTREAFYCWLDRRVPQPAFSKNVVAYAYMDSSIDFQGFIE
jgi:hypothetical protein